jgi:hypothetical protein
MNRLLFLTTILAIGPVTIGPAFAATATGQPGDVEIQMVVTVEARHGSNIPSLNTEDFKPSGGHEEYRVTNALPLRGANAALELFVLVDDASNWTLGSQLADLRRFIETQPATTAIGVGYMRNGAVETVAKLSTDHSRAAQAIRLPAGLSSSPWLSLSELIKSWPEGSARREVLIVTSGADPLGDMGSMTNPYLDTAIADAQRAGVIVYAIYTPGEGHTGHSFWRMTWGQNHLAELADETGGEAYMLGFGAPVSISPYLAEIAGHLSHQYRIALLAKGEEKPGLKPIRLTTEVPNAEIVAAAKIYVPAAH